ncbi:MarR family winged helix-turn-helix transcriptional regulator [Geothrix sp. PMB-07]|uniref:MarR family winged helix-turn-helix transcriptional regulator n=1 Tax=Geothrix sp. PMB-07 TaxID=3068640 RepID=UPI002740EE05|nr:MarR family transcriptional regulator [Geothrix sp. PMB-07]WLT30685.1 MarR family transcriptional regulator [Geothrix sp. PMB-07]
MPDSLTQAGLGTLASAVRRRLKHVVGARLAPYDLTIQQFWVMLVLLEQGASSLHPLAQQVWMDDPTASRVVKAMVERGLLRTEADPKHGRRILISLTPSALPLAQELKALATGIKTGLVAGLDADQQALMRAGMMAMITNLDGMLAGLPAAIQDEAAAS